MGNGQLCDQTRDDDEYFPKKLIQYDIYRKYCDLKDQYLRGYQEVQKIDNDIPKYPQLQHAKLVHYLIKRDQKFEDYQFVNKSQQKQVEWVRVNQVFPNAKIHHVGQDNNYTFKYHGEIHNSFMEAMSVLKDYSYFLNEVFKISTISQVGFYCLYLGFQGYTTNKIKVVIDDYIPVKYKQYQFGFPIQTQNYTCIWMILLEKALAKVMGSYQKLRELNKDEVLQKITGIPIFQAFLYQKSIQLFHDANNPPFFQSFSLDLKRENSVFLCFKTQVNLLSFTFWEKIEGKYQSDIVMELIEKQSSTIVQKCQKYKNKIIIKYQNGALKQYILHIFNRSSTCKRNLIVLAQKPFKFIKYDDQKKKHYQNLERLKKKANLNFLRQKYHELPKCYEETSTQIKTFWFGHRCYLIIKNKSDKTKQVKVRIKENFRDIIFFEDEPDKVEKCKNALLGNQFYYLFFVRRKHHESSKFYDIMIRDIS